MMQAATKPIQVRVLHPEAIVAIGLVAALRMHADIEVLEEEAPVDVIVCDLATGLEMARAVPGKVHPGSGPRLLVISPEGRDSAVRLALDIGIHGYVLRGCPVDEFTRAVRAVASGQRFLSVAAALEFAQATPRESLTLREREVLELLWHGYCNKTIARELGIAVGTVKTHVKAILSKLAASSRTQAVSLAVQRGLLDSAPWQITTGNQTSTCKEFVIFPADAWSPTPHAAG